MKQTWQFRLRTLISLPVLFAIGILLFDRLWVYDESQWGTELVEISVLDGGADLPISGAVLRSSDTEKEPNPKTTDENGIVGFAHSYKYEHFKSLLRDRYKRLSAHTIEVSALGFKPVAIEIESHRLDKDKGYDLPSPIVVRLERSGNDGENDATATKATPQSNAVNRSGESRRK
ncbi:MAG: hypothetical protein KDA60_12420 [Planctomycetales bacterium]|nr:hypothetical protein [Planctomycetales bacterium]